MFRHTFHKNLGIRILSYSYFFYFFFQFLEIKQRRNNWKNYFSIGGMYMITKNDMINEVCAIMGDRLDRDGIEELRTLLLVKFHNFQYVEDETLPSVDVFDNEWLMKRYTIDMISKGNSQSSTQQYIRMVQKFLDEIHLNYTQVTGQDITDYIAIKSHRDKISQGYKCTIQKYLRSFFRWAYRKHHIDTDITRDMDTVKPKQKLKVRLTDEEVEQCRLVASGNLRESAILEVMLSTGVRVGELIGLNVEDLNFKENLIKIWGEKTDAYRFGIMTPRCKVALIAYLQGRTSGILFPSRRGNRTAKMTMENVARGIAERANCSIPATVHVYRKTFASIMYNKTKDVLLVSKLLGHSSTQVTSKYYLIDNLDEMKHTVLLSN